MSEQQINEQQLSQQIEDILVARNPRGMRDIQPELQPGYYLRAARYFKDIKGTVLIGTGFPVLDTFETDGPVGAIALYDALQAMGAKPVFVTGNPLAQAFADSGYRVETLKVGPHEQRREEGQAILDKYQPEGIISIERPGLAQNECYHNMRGEDISARAACFDYVVRQAQCPTVAIGDGGNEIGMGNVFDYLSKLDIVPAVTRCDELCIADVSNWASYGLIAFWSLWSGKDLLADIDSAKALQWCSDHNSVDGVTRENTLTEDNMPASEGQSVLAEIRALLA